MGILDGLLSPLLTQTANARGSYLQGQRTANDKGIAEAMARVKAQREAEGESVKQALEKAQTVRAMREPTAPSEPLEVTVDAAGNRTYTPRSKAAGMTAPTPPEPLVQTLDGNGNPIYTRRPAAEGQQAPKAGGEAKPTEPQEKSYLFYNLMKNSEPTITTMQAKHTIRPAAISAYLSAEAAGNIPVIGGVVGSLAKPAANQNLNADEQRLIRAGKDFTAGVLRKESGAAVTPKELLETMERYFPGMFGDKPELTQDKTTARQQYMETMRQEAMPASEYYTKRQQRSTAPSSGGGTPAKPHITKAEADALKTQGFTDADLAQYTIVP